MSHLVTCPTRITDIELIRAICESLGWALHEGGQVRYFYGPGDECTYTIELDSETALRRYNLGLQRQQDGTYAVLCDNSMHGPVLRDGSLGGETPRILGALKQGYATMQVQRTAARLGHRIVRQAVDAQGNQWLEIAV